MRFQADVLSFPGRQRGFTIVEIVIAFIIIGILTLVMMPVLTRQTNDARINATQQDLEHLSDAMERVAVDTGYMMRPYALNDGSFGDGIPNLPGIFANRINGIRDNGVTSPAFYTDPYKFFISVTTQDFLPDGQQSNLFLRLTGSSTGSLTENLSAETEFGWHGPYINWRRDVNKNDWPDDPWGHDYLFFTKAGILYPPATGLVIDQTGAATPTPPSTSTNNDQDHTYPFWPAGPEHAVNTTGALQQFPAVNLFDKPTWMSLGPDGMPGNGSILPTDPNYGYGRGDDIYRSFGGS